jgi:hypothetical protein
VAVQDRVPSGAVRYRRAGASGSLWTLRVVLGLKFLLGIGGVYTGGDILISGSSPPSARGWGPVLLVLGVVLIGVATWLFALTSRPALVIADGLLRIRHEGRGVTEVPLGAVTGVGLVFRQWGLPRQYGPGSGWHLMIWHGDPRGESCGITYIPMVKRSDDLDQARQKFLALPGPASGATPLTFDNFDPAAETDQARLAATYAGQVTLDVYRHVLAHQGPDGSLATAEQQKHCSLADSPTVGHAIAYWSPDGVVGALEPTVLQTTDSQRVPRL